MNSVAALVLGALLLPIPAKGAEIFIETRADGATLLVFDGEIEDGDEHKMLDAVRNAPVKFIVANGMKVNSPGGSVAEALKLARVIEASGLMLNVEEGDTCASACFILYMSAQYRWAHSDAKVLIHRPYFPSVRNGNDAFSEAVQAQQAAMSEMRNYLQSRSVPSTIVDKMMKYPSNNAYRLTFNDLHREIGFLSPVLEELTLNKCGLTNSNIFLRDGVDDKACIGEFLYPRKNEYLKSLIGPEKYEVAYDKALDILSD